MIVVIVSLVQQKGVQIEAVCNVMGGVDVSGAYKYIWLLTVFSWPISSFVGPILESSGNW